MDDEGKKAFELQQRKSQTMKLRIIIALVAIEATLAWQAGAQANNTNTATLTQRTLTSAPRMWTFQQGGKIEGWLAGFQGTNQVVVRKTADNKNYSLTISSLSSDDQVYLATVRDDALTKQLDTEAKQLQKQGLVELSAKLFQNFPERIKRMPQNWSGVDLGSLSSDEIMVRGAKRVWMDASFQKVDSYFLLEDQREQWLGFAVRDKDGEHYNYCFVTLASQ
jgi:hypothetical protein